MTSSGDKKYHSYIIIVKFKYSIVFLYLMSVTYLFHNEISNNTYSMALYRVTTLLQKLIMMQAKKATVNVGNIMLLSMWKECLDLSKLFKASDLKIIKKAAATPVSKNINPSWYVLFLFLHAAYIRLLSLCLWTVTLLIYLFHVMCSSYCMFIPNSQTINHGHIFVNPG